MRMTETALLFGAGKGLVGVITDPAAGPGGGRPAVVLLNAGLLHRVGPNRLYVKLARRLAASGFVVMRFDLSGIGDSRAAVDRTSFEERAVAETRAALDLLAATRGADRFLVGGLCSGADNALRAALEDARIAGLALLEPVSGAPSAGQMLGSYRDRLLRPSSWLRLLSGRSELWSGLAHLLKARLSRRRRRPERMAPSPSVAGVAASGALVAASPESPPDPPPESPGRQMRRFAEGGGSLCLVYSADNPAHYHYAKVLGRDLRGLTEDRLRVTVVPESDHVFTPLEAQARVLDAVCAWANSLQNE
jgi:hypothetical protein